MELALSEAPSLLRVGYETLQAKATWQTLPANLLPLRRRFPDSQIPRFPDSQARRFPGLRYMYIPRYSKVPRYPT